MKITNVVTSTVNAAKDFFGGPPVKPLNTQPAPSGGHDGARGWVASVNRRLTLRPPARHEEVRPVGRGRAQRVARVCP